MFHTHATLLVSSLLDFLLSLLLPWASIFSLRKRSVEVGGFVSAEEAKRRWHEDNVSKKGWYPWIFWFWVDLVPRHLDFPRQDQDGEGKKGTDKRTQKDDTCWVRLTSTPSLVCFYLPRCGERGEHLLGMRVGRGRDEPGWEAKSVGRQLASGSFSPFVCSIRYRQDK